MEVDPGITVAIVWSDDDLIEVDVRAANSRFSGEIRAYESHSAGRDFAEALRGFPSSTADRRSFEIGSCDERAAGGGARFDFRCVDLAGHASVHVHLRAAERDVGASADFSIEVESVAVDAFVSELGRMNLRDFPVAKLRAARQGAAL